jgi:hypothetical protein
LVTITSDFAALEAENYRGCNLYNPVPLLEGHSANRTRTAKMSSNLRSGVRGQEKEEEE